MYDQSFSYAALYFPIFQILLKTTTAILAQRMVNCVETWIARLERLVELETRVERNSNFVDDIKLWKC